MGTYYSEVPIPYGNKWMDLRLDPGAKGSTADQVMGMIVDEIPWESDELIRILTAGVILYHAKAGTFGECLHTAIIWERG